MNIENVMNTLRNNLNTYSGTNVDLLFCNEEINMDVLHEAISNLQTSLPLNENSDDLRRLQIDILPLLVQERSGYIPYYFESSNILLFYYRGRIGLFFCEKYEYKYDGTPIISDLVYVNVFGYDVDIDNLRNAIIFTSRIYLEETRHVKEIHDSAEILCLLDERRREAICAISPNNLFANFGVRDYVENYGLNKRLGDDLIYAYLQYCLDVTNNPNHSR